MSLLQFGDSGDDVIEVQRILKEQGFFDGALYGNYRELTEAAVRYFQSTHIGPDGEYLEVDGIVGPATWWALKHPSGAPQRSFIDPRIPDGLSPLREDVLKLAFEEHRKRVHEEPDGSNWGPEIKKYGGRRGWAWCCLFVTWVWKRTGVVGIKQASTYRLWQQAKKNGWFHPIRTENAAAYIPGNALLWQYKRRDGSWTRTGHISILARVDDDNREYNTVGGNEGNRVKFGKRSDRSKNLIGFINPFPENEQPHDFERGTLNRAGKVEGSSTR
jgi:hypothetical protein